MSIDYSQHNGCSIGMDLAGLYAEIFPRGVQIWGTDRRGRAGGSICGMLHPAYVGCYTLHLLGGGENDTRGGGGQMPSLKYSPVWGWIWCIFSNANHVATTQHT